MHLLIRTAFIVLGVILLNTSYAYEDTHINQQLSKSFYSKLQKSLVSDITIKCCYESTSNNYRILEVMYPLFDVKSNETKIDTILIDSVSIEEVSEYLIRECNTYKSELPLRDISILYTCVTSSFDVNYLNDIRRVYIRVIIYFNSK